MHKYESGFLQFQRAKADEINTIRARLHAFVFCRQDKAAVTPAQVATCVSLAPTTPPPRATQATTALWVPSTPPSTRAHQAPITHCQPRTAARPACCVPQGSTVKVTAWPSPLATAVLAGSVLAGPLTPNPSSSVSRCGDFLLLWKLDCLMMRVFCPLLRAIEE